jgi:hypothetical protein
MCRFILHSYAAFTDYLVFLHKFVEFILENALTVWIYKPTVSLSIQIHSIISYSRCYGHLCFNLTNNRCLLNRCWTTFLLSFPSRIFPLINHSSRHISHFPSSRFPLLLYTLSCIFYFLFNCFNLGLLISMSLFKCHLPSISLYFSYCFYPSVICGSGYVRFLYSVLLWSTLLPL